MYYKFNNEVVLTDLPVALSLTYMSAQLVPHLVVDQDIWVSKMMPRTWVGEANL